MRAKIPGFFEQLFDHEHFEFNFEFINEKINVKATTHNMQNLSSAVEKVLQDNVTILKEAYYKDLKKKFPANLAIDLNNVNVKLNIKDKLSYDRFLNKIFKIALKSHNEKRYDQTVANRTISGQFQKSYVMNPPTAKMLTEFFQSHNWINENGIWLKEIKTAEQLQIIFAQICSILDNTLDINFEISKFK